MSIEARFRIRRPGFELAVELSLPTSGVCAISGPSGCGKTTLLRALAGLEFDPRGYCRVRDALWQDAERFLPVHARPLGVVFQESSLFPHLNVRGNLLYGYKRVARQKRRLQLDEVVSLMRLEGMLDRAPDGLSGGERQRVAIARALLTSPSLMLLDEPLAALDRPARREIMPFLERLRDRLDIPMLYVSHNPEEISRLADHVLMMEAGKVLAVGPTEQLYSDLDLALHREQAESIIQTRLAEQDEQYQLSYLDFSAGRFSVGRQDLPIGHPVRLRILARDVSITLDRQAGTSILNVFPARVVKLLADGPSRVLVSLDLGGSSLLAGITRKSADNLRLVPGQVVFAQIKSLALLV